MSYDFSTLNDKELEELSRDILNKKLKIDFQNFKVGKDGGIDLRYSSSKNLNKQIVQVKHYLKSGFNRLYSDLKVELKKVKLLAPQKYYLVTSLPLNANQKDKLYNLFHPYIKTPNDIFSQEDLNKYLKKYSEIEKKWFKLWLSSTEVLQIILNNGILGKSVFTENSIKKNVQLYVQSDSYNDAINILTNYKYILITGQPGVGKTTLAKLLTLELLADGYQLIYIDDDLKEAEALYDPDPLKKQIFYFDDFLGSNYLEIINSKTSETAIVNFLERIKESKNKYLILTTRTIIFRSALAKFEKLNRSRIDIARKEIELGSYSDLEKAKILYNHLFHSSLSEDFANQIFQNKNYWKIIKHKNYYPRLIEFFTNPLNLRGINSETYLPFIMKNLENPSEVWRYAYENQFQVEEKLILHSIFCQPYLSSIVETKKIFENLLEAEIQKYFFRPQTNPFNNACKKLLDGIIKKETYLHDQSDVLSFINPSINDFLINYFINNEEERWKLIDSFLFIEQYETIASSIFNNRDFKKLIEKSETSKFVKKLLDKINSVILLKEQKHEAKNSIFKHFRILALACRLNTSGVIINRVDVLCNSVLKNFPIQNLNSFLKPYFLMILNYHKDEGLVSKWVKQNWQEIIEKLISKSIDEDDFDNIKNLFDSYNESFRDFMSVDSNYELFYEVVQPYVDEETHQWIKDEQSDVHDKLTWENLKDNIAQIRSDFFQKYNLEDNDYSRSDYFNDYMYQQLVQKYEERDANDYYDKDDWRNLSQQSPSQNPTNEIDNLFSQ